jgi:hypothetical protein
VIAVLLLILLAVPTLVWVIIRTRAKISQPPTRQVSEGPKHRWWQP